MRLYNNLTLPVNNTDIMPCLTCRALDSFPSSAAISASMSLRISAITVDPRTLCWARLIIYIGTMKVAHLDE